jgi:hypothetical protein
MSVPPPCPGREVRAAITLSRILNVMTARATPASAAVTPPLWSVREHVAVPVPEVAASLPARLDLKHLAAGLVWGEDSATADRLLGVDLRADCPPADVWLRGPDITAVYEPADDRRLRATAMWRLHPRPAGLGAGTTVRGCELIISAQTSVLESDSTIPVLADLVDGERLWGRPQGRDGMHWIAAATQTTQPPHATAVLVRRRDSSVVVAVHPADVRAVACSAHGSADRPGRCRITAWLFTGLTEKSIEKGVLLRGRVCAVRGPATSDAAWATAVIGAFNASPPPLTT